MGLARQWRFLRGLCAERGVAAAAMRVPLLFPPCLAGKSHLCAAYPWACACSRTACRHSTQAAGMQALHRHRASSQALAC